MRNLIEQYELVKEIEFHFEGIDHKIIGRIYKIILGPRASYTWKVNYYCRHLDEAMPYMPSAPFGETIEETEIKLTSYVKRFEKAEDWEINTFF